MNRKRLALMAGALLIALVAAACSNDGGETNADQTSPAETVSPITISSGSTQIDIGGGSLPEGFPDSFPLPDGATPVNSVGGTDGYFVWFSSDQSVDELRSFFQENLPSSGWTISNTMETTTAEGTFTIYTISGNGFSGGVYVGESASGTDTFTGEYAFNVQLYPEQTSAGQ